MSYRPTALLTVVRVALVALFTTVTVTPGITPPVESLTSPVMVPSVCAKQGAQRSNDVNPTNRGRRIGRLLPRKGSGVLAWLVCDDSPHAFDRSRTAGFDRNARFAPNQRDRRARRPHTSATALDIAP